MYEIESIFLNHPVYRTVSTLLYGKHSACKICTCSYSGLTAVNVKAKHTRYCWPNSLEM